MIESTISRPASIRADRPLPSGPMMARRGRAALDELGDEGREPLLIVRTRGG